jgi:peptidoglycan hydrolase CwlO-like protein
MKQSHDDMILQDTFSEVDKLEYTIEHLKDELYEANYKHDQALDEISILNDTIKTLQKTIDRLSSSLLESRE